MKLFSNPTTTLLEQSIHAASLRQKTIAQNIANVDTPNYKAKQTVFKHQLDQAIRTNEFRAHRTNAKHLEFSTKSGDRAIVKNRQDTMFNHNGNNVDIDFEMSQMAQNQIYYNALIDRLNGQFNSIKTVLGSGR